MSTTYQIDTTNFTSPIVDSDFINQGDAHRANAAETARLRAKLQWQQNKANYVNRAALVYGPDGSKIAPEVAPKWKRYADDYYNINPHLAKHERPPIAPRYGPDAVKQNIKPKACEGTKCRCDWCLTSASKRRVEKREVNVALKAVITPQRHSNGGAPRMGTDRQWDDDGYHRPAVDEHDMSWDRPTTPPQPTLDIMSMAKPAKQRKRKGGSTGVGVAGTSKPSLLPSSSTLYSVDEISILDFEETWEHLDLEDRMQLFGTDVDHSERGSEWEWERFSQF